MDGIVPLQSYRLWAKQSACLASSASSSYSRHYCQQSAPEPLAHTQILYFVWCAIRLCFVVHVRCCPESVDFLFFIFLPLCPLPFWIRVLFAINFIIFLTLIYSRAIKCKERNNNFFSLSRFCIRLSCHLFIIFYYIFVIVYVPLSMAKITYEWRNKQKTAIVRICGYFLYENTRTQIQASAHTFFFAFLCKRLYKKQFHFYFQKKKKKWKIPVSRLYCAFVLILLKMIRLIPQHTIIIQRPSTICGISHQIPFHLLKQKRWIDPWLHNGWSGSATKMIA